MNANVYWHNAAPPFPPHEVKSETKCGLGSISSEEADMSVSMLPLPRSREYVDSNLILPHVLQIGAYASQAATVGSLIIHASKPHGRGWSTPKTLHNSSGLN